MKRNLRFERLQNGLLLGGLKLITALSTELIWLPFHRNIVILTTTGQQKSTSRALGM